jgi:glutamate 5-kinase
MLMSFKDMQLREDSGGNLDVVGLHDSAHQEPNRNHSFVNLLNMQERPHTSAQKKKVYDSACAAAGQFEMMNLYSNLFAQCDVSASQILVTQSDFVDPVRRNNLHYAIERLLSLGIVPIINENDAVSANLGYTADDVFSDNDSLAAICARTFNAEVLLLLTDVEGVFDRPPSEPGSKKLELYRPESSEVAIGEKSAQGKFATTTSCSPCGYSRIPNLSSERPVVILR